MPAFRPAALVLALASCAPSTDPGTDGGDNSGKLTLDTCTTSIAADAPAFFQRYFKCVTVTKTSDGVKVTSSGLPPHDSAYYATTDANWVAFDTSRGAGYRQNPNRIAAKAVSLTIPDAPVSKGISVVSDLVDLDARTSALEYSGGTVGIALDGVAMFNSTAAPGDDIAEERFTFDSYEAHPTQDGTYHYHAPSPGPLEVLAKAGLTTNTTPGEAALELFGIMCDGTVVLGCTELDGTARATTGLDAQGGHTHDLEDADGTLLWAGRYHTHVCTKDGGFAYTPEIQFYSTCTR